jgi:hypothetical protein
MNAFPVYGLLWLSSMTMKVITGSLSLPTPKLWDNPKWLNEYMISVITSDKGPNDLPDIDPYTTCWYSPFPSTPFGPTNNISPYSLGETKVVLNPPD